MFHVLYCTHADYVSLISGGSPHNVVAKRASGRRGARPFVFDFPPAAQCLSHIWFWLLRHSCARFNSVFAPHQGFLGFLGILIFFPLKILLSQPKRPFESPWAQLFSFVHESMEREIFGRMKGGRDADDGDVDGLRVQGS